MAQVLEQIKKPDLFFGLVAPIGADATEVVNSLKQNLHPLGYELTVIKVTDHFPSLVSLLHFHEPLTNAPADERYRTYIAFGDNLRRHFGDNSILAEIAIREITKHRDKEMLHNKNPKDEGRAYLIHQFKRKEELDLLRTIYGRLFFQISVYSNRAKRVDTLSRRIAKSRNMANATGFRDKAEALVQTDEHEKDLEHGQRLAEIFHGADFIVNLDLGDAPVDDQIGRFVKLIFGANCYSPSPQEYGLFLAKTASLSSLDLSRQVGVAIFSADGDIVALGTNEVPKANGGVYGSEKKGVDDRDFKRNEDSNQRRKREILLEIVSFLRPDLDAATALKDERIRNSQFMDTLEYGRVVHAEMNAIANAARTGRSLSGATLYSTTFPCHLCAKHIVAAGIKEVIFLEPYPKSLVSELHSDSIAIEGHTRGEYAKFPAVQFKHFYGVSHRRYKDLFERGKRKDQNGEFKE